MGYFKFFNDVFGIFPSLVFHTISIFVPLLATGPITLRQQNLVEKVIFLVFFYSHVLKCR